MLSFIIPAHDEAEAISATLRAVQWAAAEIGEPYEIIVVDDTSSDGTGAIAEAAGCRVVRVAARQIAAARNAGAAIARGDTLVFVDADTLVSVAVIRGAVAAIRAGAVGGGAAVRFDDPPRTGIAVLAGWVLWAYQRVGLAAGCFLFCSRDVFAAVGGFDERLFAAEEIALSRALRRRGRFVILKGAVVTSGRKLRTHSGSEWFRALASLALAGPHALRDRRRLGLWYGPRRREPTRLVPEADEE